MVGGKRCFFIQENKPETIFHGSVGNMDAEQVFLANGLEPVRFPFHYNFSLWAKLGRLAYLFKFFFTLPRGAVVFFQHPMYAGMNKLLIKLLRYRKSITIVCFIADINGLKHGDEAVLQQEIKQFRQYRYFILHNQAMQQWLRKQVPEHEAALIEFFDFLTTPSDVKREPAMSIAFAGNLEKSPFLEKMDAVASRCPSISFNLYGPHVTPAMQAFPNVRYKGVVEPYSLPQVLEGAFGLVWDGEGVAEPEGSMGHYMQYISHHKTSLYILCRMPLIVYEEAGTAGLIKRYGIGFTIRSLFEIEEKLKALSATEYRQMCDNTVALAKKISTGGCSGSAVHSILEKMQAAKVDQRKA